VAGHHDRVADALFFNGLQRLAVEPGLFSDEN
jgi:hypothetical protein